MTQRSKYENKNPLHRYALGMFMRRIEDAVRDTGTRKIVDVGCGDGYVIRALKESDPSRSFLGIDTDEEALARAHEMNPDARFAYGDARTYELRGVRSDLVMALEIMEHIEDTGAVLSNLWRFDTRHFLISVPHEPLFRILNFMRGRHWMRFGNHPEHIHTWGKREFKRVISPHFSVAKDYSSFPWIIFLAVKK